MTQSPSSKGGRTRISLKVMKNISVNTIGHIKQRNSLAVYATTSFWGTFDSYRASINNIIDSDGPLSASHPELTIVNHHVEFYKEKTIMGTRKLTVRKPPKPVTNSGKPGQHH